MAKFQKGNPGGPGRPKGCRDGATLIKMALTALDKAGGVEYLVATAKSSPPAFLAFVGKIIPRDVNLSADIGPTLEDCLLKVARGALRPEVEQK